MFTSKNLLHINKKHYSKLLLFFTPFTILFLNSCNSNPEPQFKYTSKNLYEFSDSFTFDYLIYNNDFNAIEAHNNSPSYKTKKNDSTDYYYELTNKKEFSPGYKALIINNNELRNILVKFDIRKPYKEIKSHIDFKSNLIIQLNRKDSVILFKSFDIAKITMNENKNIIEHFRKICLSYKFPFTPEKYDLLKIYIWNPYGGIIHLDNFTVESWKKATSTKITTDDLKKENFSIPKDRKIKDKSITSNMPYTQICKYEGYEFLNIFKKTLDSLKVGIDSTLSINFEAYKKKATTYFQESSRLAIAIKRKDENIHWKEYKIDCRMWSGTKFQSNKWIPHSVNFKLPERILEDDTIYIYFWNSFSTPLYIRNISVSY